MTLSSSFSPLFSETIFSSTQYFPSDVLKWMKKNASKETSLKLMQICKYFQLKKFPYFVSRKTFFEENLWTLHYNKIEPMQVANVSIFPDNFTVAGIMSLTHCPFIKQLISKIVICDISMLYLYNQNISCINFQFLTANGKVKELILENSRIKTRHGQLAPFDTILKCLPKAKSIYIRGDVPSIHFPCEKSSLAADLKIELWHINHKFDFYRFSIFMMKHQDIDYILSFNTKNDRILKTMRDILLEWTPKYSRPFLFFRGQEDPEIEKLRKIAPQELFKFRKPNSSKNNTTMKTKNFLQSLNLL